LSQELPIAWKENGMAHPNEEALRQGYEAFGRGDIETVMGLFTDDIKWHAPGRNDKVSGDYYGKQEVGGFIQKLMEHTGGTFKLAVHDLLANDEHGVALVKLTGERKGKSLNTNDVHVWHVTDGKFSEFWSSLQDLYAFDEFWAD
jgi:ketosteroid isomerase-like protein